MTTQTGEKPVARRTGTGWSRTRRGRGEGAPRTCLPAVEDRGASAAAHTGEWNIVRGED
ncbi:hypothetical protein [Streptomyces fulvoviolaceus]|uniref:hypothetical protein n=1 Tax=Streptomyces fulvoviolaceus TaxID=285535 RepID=UPI0018FEC1C0|nr:hypothetical protein [Streptomyces fulvoviolaceus]MCT9078019.1 hypothetical protein [Streptomyces fulvoviolaceus]